MTKCQSLICVTNEKVTLLGRAPVSCLSVPADLNVGTGDPWAGQERLRGEERGVRRPKVVYREPENLGGEPPTGSKEGGDLSEVGPGLDSWVGVAVWQWV